MPLGCPWPVAAPRASDILSLWRSAAETGPGSDYVLRMEMPIADVPTMRWQRRHGSRNLRVLLLLVILGLAAPFPMLAAERQECVRAEIVLWGDGRHDDTFALNAWLRGEDAIWADSGAPVGATISGRSFRLTAAIYVRAGSGRTLHEFRMEWPERGEVVSGGTILAGDDPDSEPVMSGINIVGGDAGEGVPFEAPDHPPSNQHSEASCATS
jgi:hypothetical protein